MMLVHIILWMIIIITKYQLCEWLFIGTWCNQMMLKTISQGCCCILYNGRWLNQNKVQLMHLWHSSRTWFFFNYLICMYLVKIYFMIITPHPWQFFYGKYYVIILCTYEHFQNEGSDFKKYTFNFCLESDFNNSFERNYYSLIFYRANLFENLKYA